MFYKSFLFNPLSSMNIYMHPTKAIGEDYERIYAFVNLFNTISPTQLSVYEMNTCLFLSSNSKQKINKCLFISIIYCSC